MDHSTPPPATLAPRPATLRTTAPPPPASTLSDTGPDASPLHPSISFVSSATTSSSSQSSTSSSSPIKAMNPTANGSSSTLTTAPQQAALGTMSASAPGPAPTAAPHADPLRRRRGVVGWIQHAVLNTPPSFYAMTMGTGITSILLYKFPYNAHWLQVLGIIVFVINVVLYSVLSILTIARYVFFRGVFGIVAKHNVAGFFWGCAPMGFTTIVNMMAFVLVPAWHGPWAAITFGFWWFNVVTSILVNFGMVFTLFTRQSQTATSFAPTILLPIVTSVVAAASGALVSEALMPINLGLARSTLIVSFVVWGTGVPVAMMVVALLIYRFALGGPPGPMALASVFLPLGPMGQGSYGIINLGASVRRLAYDYDYPFIPGMTDAMGAKYIADGIYAGCLITGLIMWGLAFMWYTLGAFMFIDGVRKDWRLLAPGKFSVGLWALTFPIGVFATSTISLASELKSPAFKVLAAFVSAQVIFHWVIVSFLTIAKLFRQELFAAPELLDLDDGAVDKRYHWSRTRGQGDLAQDIEAAYGVPEPSVHQSSGGTVTPSSHAGLTTTEKR